MTNAGIYLQEFESEKNKNATIKMSYSKPHVMHRFPL